ncbi:MAG: LysM peptidoglycan-binding domain-containing protein, partial [Nitrospiraceae bacterium]
TDKPAAKSGTPGPSTRAAAAGEPLMTSDRRPVRIAVERGDTLALIALLYGVSVPALMDANGLRSDLILVGQELVIPRSLGMGRHAGANGR